MFGFSKKPPIKVHILDPNRSSPGHITEFWKCGEDIDEKDYERMRKTKSDIYVVIAYEEGKKNKMVVPLETWKKVKATYDDMDKIAVNRHEDLKQKLSKLGSGNYES